MLIQEAKTDEKNTTPAVADPAQGRTTTGGPPEAEAGAILTIDCQAIVQNWRTLSSHAAPAECGAVVKADAYGCGLEPVVKALADAGCRTFFVAHLDEARRLRSTVHDAIIYVTNGIPPGSAAAFADISAQPVIGNLAELSEWDAYRSTSQWHGGAALHFDTGMNRLGLALEDAPALAARAKMPNHGFTLIMSHFACSDVPDHPLNNAQTFALREIRGMFRGIPASMANSAGIYLGASAHFDLVRPGIALYGGNPTPGLVNHMKPVVDLKARIVQIREVEKSATVGYDATWTAKRATKLAIASAGYADGYPRPMGGSDKYTGGEALIADRRCPVVGRVSMDLIAVDITDVPGPPPRRGDFMTLIGGNIDIDQVGQWSRTISYDVLTRLGRRYHRVWKS